MSELERNDGLAFGDNESTVPSGQRPCPICGDAMQVEMMSGASIDVCGKHGVWLDNGELPKILSVAKRRGGRTQTEALKRAKLDGKKSAMIFGVWSLLMD